MVLLSEPVPWLEALRQSFPLDGGRVSAGLPSPAQDYEEQRLGISEYLVRNPVSTIFPLRGDSMEGADIFDGDILVVDKSITLVHGRVGSR